MSLIRSRTARIVAGTGAAVALALPMAAQAEAATTTVRLHASTATGESLQGPGVFGTSVSLAQTNFNASNQKWQKTDVAPIFATYKLVSSIGTNREMCLTAEFGNPRPFVRECNSIAVAQQWTRGFENDGRIQNRRTLDVLTRQPNGVVEVRPLFGGQVGQVWHEHTAS
jgi:hypothetical protein